MLRQLGLVGYPLSHSFSKTYFTEKWQQEGIDGWAYDLYPMPSLTDLRHWLSALPTALVGFNVTIPYKQSILPFLTAIDPTAAAVGAVNTVVITPQRTTVGYNTDIIGVEKSLQLLIGAEVSPTQALIFGTGGAAQAVAYALRARAIRYEFVSATHHNPYHWRYTDLTPTMLQHYPLLINTTPLGMYPQVQTAPDMPYQALTERHYLLDLVYNPAETLWLRYGKARGCKVLNGLPMLQAQAAAAWALWQKNSV